MKPEELSISGETFKSLREQVDGALRACIRKMRETGMHEGSVGAKISIEILDDEPVTTMDFKTIRADTLKIDGKVTMTVPMRYENKLATQVGLKCIGSGGGFVIADNQITIEELLENSRSGDEDDDEL